MRNWKVYGKAIGGGVMAVVSIAAAFGWVAPEAWTAERVQTTVTAILGAVAAIVAIVYQIRNAAPDTEEKDPHDPTLQLSWVTVLLAGLMMIVLSACVTTPAVQIETAEERLVFSAMLVKATAEQVARARDEGRITESQALQAKRDLQAAQDGLVTARTALDVGRVDQATAALIGVTAALTVVREILDGRSRTGTGGRTSAGHGDHGARGLWVVAARLPAHEAAGYAGKPFDRLD